MTDKLARGTPSSLTRFEPEQAKRRDAEADAVIGYAQRVKDWPLLEKAVDVKIQDQQSFVTWWRATVQHDGRQSTGADRGRLPRTQAEKQTGIAHQDVSRWAARLEDPDAYRARLVGAAYREAMLIPEENFRALGTGDNEWYTPAEYLGAARDVMGEIDLDPATSAHGQKIVQATRYYTRAEDGLAHDWHGRIWLNPPYSAPDIGRFIAKWAQEIDAGHVQASIVLTHNYTDAGWFHHAERFAACICFTRGRVRFVDARGAACMPTQGQAFFYSGRDAARFREVFSAFGFVR